MYYQVFTASCIDKKDMKNTIPIKVPLGDWTLWSLSDGYLDLDQRDLFDEDLSVIQNQLRTGEVKFQKECIVRTPVNIYLIDTKKHLILVNTGCGEFLGPTTGLLIDRLQEVGCDPGKISHVLITHLHGDHMGGLVNPHGKEAFPRATLYVSENDADFWREPSQEARSIDMLRPFFPLARKVLSPYESNGRLQLIGPNEEIIPGVGVIEAFGHTCGHLAFYFSSQGKLALLWGDLVHTAGIQLEKPQWKVGIDTDSEQAVKSRNRLFAKAADQKFWLVEDMFPILD